MHEVTLKSAQLESKRKKVCTKCAQKWISHHLKCAKRVQNVKKSLHKVCKKSVKRQKKCAFFLPNAHFADLCTLLKKCARICPPMYDMQVKTYDVVYDDSIRCRTSDLRYRINIRHRMVAMSYVLRHRMFRCRTCLTYDIVCNIGIIGCRTSDVRHRTSARIQMLDLPERV